MNPPPLPIDAGRLFHFAQQSDELLGVSDKTRLALMHRVLEGAKPLAKISLDWWLHIGQFEKIDVSRWDTSPYELLAADLRSRRPIDPLTEADKVKFGFQAEDANNQQEVQGLNFFWRKATEMLLKRSMVIKPKESAAA
jgi:hypothetical protein